MNPSTLAINGGTKVRDDFLVYGAPLIGEDEIAEVVDCLRSGWVGTGPKTQRFQSMFAEYVGAEHAIGVSSCTAALHLSLLALGIGAGDEVITTPMTFAATANAIIHTGATPVFVDVDKTSQNLDSALIESAITPKTKAVLPVHFAGHPCDMTSINAIAAQHGLVTIEDAAHCIEGVHDGQHVGSISEATAFSFYVTKNLATVEGGMITTNNGDIADELRVRALHGMSKDAWARYSQSGFKHYDVVSAGFKYNLTDIQSAMGIHQLARIDDMSARRKQIWERYHEAFADLPIDLLALPTNGDTHALHLYQIFPRLEELSATRDEIVEAIQAENVGIGIHYRALSEHSFYQEELGVSSADYPNAKWLSDRTISLPFSARLSDDDVADVISTIVKVTRSFQA